MLANVKICILYQNGKCLEHHENKSQYHGPQTQVSHSNYVYLLYLLLSYLEMKNFTEH